MDIAKIRKKVKEESDIRRGGKEGKESETHPVEENLVEETEGRTEKSEDGTQSAETTGEKSEDISEIIPRETLSPEIVKSEIHSGEKESHSEAAVKIAEPAEMIEDVVELLTFHLSTEEFAFRVSDIEEILRFQRITMVPKVPEYILGITSLRGKIIPVIDLKLRLSIKGKVEIEESRKKILILKGSKGPFGTLIDRVKGVIRISPSDIVEPPAHLTEAELRFIEGVVLHSSRFISVIRMGEILDINLK